MFIWLFQIAGQYAPGLLLSTPHTTLRLLVLAAMSVYLSHVWSSEHRFLCLGGQHFTELSPQPQFVSCYLRILCQHSSEILPCRYFWIISLYTCLDNIFGTLFSGRVLGSIPSALFVIFFFLYFLKIYVYDCSVCTFLSLPEEEGIGFPYRWLRATMWVLGLELRIPGSALNCCAPLQPLILYFFLKN